MRKIQDPKSEVPLPGFEAFHDDFLASRKEEIVTLKSALAAQDFKALVSRAHQWKGFAAPYGFQELETRAINLEKHALNSDHDQCAKILKEIEEYLG